MGQTPAIGMAKLSGNTSRRAPAVRGGASPRRDRRGRARARAEARRGGDRPRPHLCGPDPHRGPLYDTVVMAAVRGVSFQGGRRPMKQAGHSRGLEAQRAPALLETAPPPSSWLAPQLSRRVHHHPSPGRTPQPSQDLFPSRPYEPQLIEQFPLVSQNVVLTGEGEQVVEPLAWGLSVEAPMHQFQ
jgi:hypothetical protein